MVAAAERARDMNYEVLASLGALQAGMDAYARGASVDAAANAYLAGEAEHVAQASAEAAAATDAAGDAAASAAAKITADDAAMRGAAEAARDLAASDVLAAAANDAVTGSAVKSAAATDAAAASTSRWFGVWRLSGTAIHWIISGSAELLAVTLPAAVAAASGAFVLYQGVVEQVGFRMESMYGATEATAAMIGKTTGDVLGLGHAFQTAQNAANPIAYELLGEYIDAARSHMVDLAGAGLQVDQALGELGARIDVDLISQSGELNSLLANMVSDLVEIGQVFGNVGHAVLNLAADMPGLAEVLLRVADAASRVVLWISELPAPIITTFMVFEEFSRWGGLVVSILNRMGLAGASLSGGIFTVERFGGILAASFRAIPMLFATVISNIGSLVSGFGRMPGPIGRAGLAMRDFGADMTDAVVAVPAADAAITALALGGIGFLIYKAVTATSVTQDFTNSLQADVSKVSNLAAFGTIAQNIAAIGDKFDQTSKRVAAGGARIGDAVTAVNPKLADLSAGMQQQMADARNLFNGAVTLSNAYGGSLTQSMALADVAGVKLSTTQVTLGKNMNVAGAQIQAVVTGYQRMDQVGGVLNNDMNALSIQAGLQDTKVSSLNQAWDQFMSNATGLTSSFAGLETDLGEIDNAITTAGTKFDVFGGKVVSTTQAASMSMRSFSGTGAQVWQNYDAALSQAEQYTDSLRTAAAYGAVSQKSYTESIAYTVQQLLPYARYSQTATEELSALAQEAGGPATSNYKTLAEWTDKNTTSTSNFNKIMQQETGQLSDVSQAATEFASTLQSDLIQAMVSAGLKFSTVNSLINHYASLISQGDAATSAGRAARGALIKDLEGIGMNAKQAAAMVKLMGGEIAGLHSKTVTLTVNGQITSSGAAALSASGGNPAIVRHVAGGTYATGAEYAAAGLALVGDAGPELVRFPAAGAEVLPSWQTAAAMHGGGGGEGEIHLVNHNPVYVSGAKVASATRTQVLSYGRRNGTSNWTLRNGRGR